VAKENPLSITSRNLESLGHSAPTTNYIFLTFDIVEFYPSITQDLLEKVIRWAKTMTTITDEQESIIYHARNSLLLHNNTPWVKTNNDTMFDVTMGSFDGAEICDLVGLFLLINLAKKFGNKFVGLYRDDGLAIIKSKSATVADKVRKEMHKIFKSHGLRITAEINHHTVNFLDITLNLSDETDAPYIKPNNVPLYIHSNSNHPPTIIKQIPTSINKTFTKLTNKT
jgi:predicted membrane-bound spermidine synthase